MSEQKTRVGDPLVLAMRAIQEYERAMGETPDAQVKLTDVYQMAALRTQWALAAEVRALRFTMEGAFDETGDS
jgi:hypothetical protein